VVVVDEVVDEVVVDVIVELFIGIVMLPIFSIKPSSAIAL